MKKVIQHFSDDYLEHCRSMSPTQIIEFLEGHRRLRFNPGPLKQINIRVPENTLAAFKAKAKREGIIYQQKLRELLTEWALS